MPILSCFFYKKNVPPSYPEFVILSSKIFATEDGEKKIQLIKVNFKGKIKGTVTVI